MRGYAPRAQINTTLINIVEKIMSVSVKIDVSLKVINITLVYRLMTIMFIYSAIKINANVPELYSVLNPDTSSDSPSARSKGVRFVSASLVINHITATGHIINVSLILWLVTILLNLSVCIIIIGDKMTNAILTSYEIVCAILRNAPNNAYLLLEAQPLNKIEYTFILETHRKITTPHLKNKGEHECGYKFHRISAKNNPIIGAPIKAIEFAIVGLFSSFENSLIASANGWGIPLILTLFGPLRSWM